MAGCSEFNKRGGSNKACSWEFFYIYYIKKQYLWQVSQKLINVEVIIRHVVGKFFSKRIKKTPCLLETSEYDNKFYDSDCFWRPAITKNRELYCDRGLHFSAVTSSHGSSPHWRLRWAPCALNFLSFEIESRDST